MEEAKKAFSAYRELTNEQLTKAGIDSDSIESLLNCRSLINAQQEYLHDLSSRYYQNQKEEESLYKFKKATVILEAANPTKGKVEVDLVDRELREAFTKAEGIYKKVRGFLETLNSKDDILKQKISYLKQEQSLNNFVKG